MMLYVYFKAPFGAFRPFKNVELSPTAEFLTHSAAYGILLGLAGIERDLKKKFAGARLALGSLRVPTIGRSLQLLIQGKRTLEEHGGGNFKLRPFLREVLCDIEGYIALDHHELETLVRQGIDEPSTVPYWGLPFMGDNNFFIERLETKTGIEPCQWLCELRDDAMPLGEKLFYLSVWTDYVGNEKSDSRLFYLSENNNSPPPTAWISIQERQE
jgi:CRISPR-associated protein Cas5t